MTRRLVVLVSGNGTNLQALIDATADGSLDAEVVAVVANRPARGIERAEAAGIPGIVLERTPGEARADYDARLVEVVGHHRPDLVVMAGWLRITTMVFLEAFPVINIHPALPGMFPGLHAIDRAFEAWQADAIDHSGVMVHWVPDEGVDDGPVIAQRVVPFEIDDTLDSFEDRVHRVEHGLLVEAVELAFTQGPPSVRSSSSASPTDRLSHQSGVTP